MSTRFEAGPVLAAAATIAGVLAGARATAAPATGALALGALLLVASLACTGASRVAVAMVAFALLGCAACQRARHGLVDNAIMPIARARTEVVVHGVVASDPDVTRYSTALVVRVSTFATARDPTRSIAAHRLVVARASDDEASPLAVLVTGDRVVLSGRLEPIDGYDARLRWRHVTARLAAAHIDDMHGASAPLWRAANAVRNVTMQGAGGLGATDRALFAGFLLGDTHAIPGRVVDDYRAAGLSHLLAVSGANVAFVLALFGPLLRRSSLRPRLVVGCAVVVVFAAATRFEPSVLRASVMAAVTMSAAYVGRPVSTLRVLSIAVIALLLADPFLLWSVGFLLSVGASAGIALTFAPIARHTPGPRLLADTFAVTIAAQLGVAPVMLPVFGSLPAIAPVANVLAVPIAEPLTVYGFASAFAEWIAGPLRPLAAASLHVPTAVMLGWVTFVAHGAAQVPFALDGRAVLGLAAVGFLVAGAAKAGGTLRGDAGDPISEAASR